MSETWPMALDCPLCRHTWRQFTRDLCECNQGHVFEFVVDESGFSLRRGEWVGTGFTREEVFEAARLLYVEGEISIESDGEAVLEFLREIMQYEEDRKREEEDRERNRTRTHDVPLD